MAEVGRVCDCRHPTISARRKRLPDTTFVFATKEDRSPRLLARSELNFGRSLTRHLLARAASSGNSHENWACAPRSVFFLRRRAIEFIQCDRKCQNIRLGQLKRPLVRMIMGSFIVEGSRTIEFNMRSKGITNGVRTRKASYPLRAFLVRVGILNRKAAREEQVARKKQPRPIIIERDVGGRMSRRRNDIDDSIAQIDVGDSIGPSIEPKECPHFFEVRRYELPRVTTGTAGHLPSGPGVHGYERRAVAILNCLRRAIARELFSRSASPWDRQRARCRLPFRRPELALGVAAARRSEALNSRYAGPIIRSGRTHSSNCCSVT
jgi:hypothetical protein